MTPIIPREFVDKYNKPGPRYTSYPTVPAWDQEFGPVQYREALTELNTRFRYLTPCSLRTSRMLASVKMSANGSPSLRAKRARTASRLVIEPPSS